MSDPQKSDSLSEECSTSSKLIVCECTSVVSDSPSEKDSASDDNKRYYPWASTEFILQNEDYCNLDELLEAFNKIETIDLDSYDERQKAILILKELPTMKLVGKKKRFPEDKAYVNLTRSIYATCFRRIIEALDCENNCTDGGRQIYNCTCKEIFFLRLNCARKLHAELPITLLHCHGLFTRKYFEKWNAVEWK